jgi:aminopeptidase N
VAFKESSNGSDSDDPSTSVVLVLSAMKATFAFKTVGAPDGGSVEPFADGEPLPSLLRNFSAPVTMTVVPAFDTKESVFFFAHDSDPFNRWEAAQTMARGIICRAYRAAAVSISETNTDADYDGAQCDFASIIVSDEAWPAFAGACASIVDDAANDKVDRAWAEEALSFPGVAALLREVAPANPVLVHRTRSAFVKAFAKHCVVPLKNALETCEKESHAAKDAGESVRHRRKANRSPVVARVLSRRVGVAGCGVRQGGRFRRGAVLRDAYDGAQNMTETVSVLNALAKVDALNDDDANGVLRATFKRFLETWKDDANVSCTYLSSVAQLSAYVSDCLSRTTLTKRIRKYQSRARQRFRGVRELERRIFKRVRREGPEQVLRAHRGFREGKRLRVPRAGRARIRFRGRQTSRDGQNQRHRRVQARQALHGVAPVRPEARFDDAFMPGEDPRRETFAQHVRDLHQEPRGGVRRERS